jgi:excisionase family DNA binding protein
MRQVPRLPWAVLPYILNRWGIASVNGLPAMTVRDVAGYLNVDEKTVYRLTKRGSLPGFKVAGAWRFKKQDIDEWIERQKNAAAREQLRGRGTA